MEGLSKRQQAILDLVVRDYIKTAIPVSSKTIVEGYGLRVSTATVRNEMAYLEERGYLTRPHTSAGRVPTDKGYRYFVENLMEEVELPLDKRLSIHRRFRQIRREIEQWIRTATMVLAQAAHSAALVTTPRAHKCRFKHLELVSIQGPTVLLILVLREGRVMQRVLTLTKTASQHDLSRTANRLNDLLDGMNAERIASSFPRLIPSDSRIAEIIFEMMRSVDERASEIYYNGLINLLKQPEFSVGEKARKLLNLFEAKELFGRVLAEELGPAVGGIQFIIGGEGRWEELSEFSLVLSRYGVKDYATGALGVLGPLRMQYERIVPAVRCVANLMSELVEEMCGLQRRRQPYLTIF
jgi:heat-inducible transcriptional repressor